MLDVRYIAGIVDGEGCVTVIKRLEKHMDRVSYRLVVQVSMTHEGVIKALQDSIGGSYSAIHWHTRRNNRTAYQWRKYGVDAVELLQSILPYLIVKKAEAELAIAFQGNLDQWRNKLRHAPEDVQKAVWEYRESSYWALRALKKVSGALDGMDANSENTQTGQLRAKLRSV